MNESDFEAELRQMRPAPVRDAVRMAIEADLKPTAKSPASGVITTMRAANRGYRFLQIIFRTGLTLGTAALVASAIVGVRLGVSGNSPETGAPLGAAPEIASAAAGSFLRVASSRELVDAGDEEILYPDAADPAMRVRLRSIERHAWADMERGAFIAIEVPREDVVLIPVSMQ
jgi:hypothetical protein